MTKMELAIAALSGSGYEVLVHIGSDDAIAFKNNKLCRCIVKTAVEDGKRASVLRTRYIKQQTSWGNDTLVIAARPLTGEVWIIPLIDIIDAHVIRLGKRWDIYKYTVSVTSKKLEDEKAVMLKEAAANAVVRLKGALDVKITKPTETDEGREKIQ